MRIPAIGAVGVVFDEFPNGEAIRGFAGRDGHVLAHECASLGLEDGPGFEKRLDPVSPIFTATPSVLWPFWDQPDL
jgi:hypothetical protein